MPNIIKYPSNKRDRRPTHSGTLIMLHGQVRAVICSVGTQLVPCPADTVFALKFEFPK